MVDHGLTYAWIGAKGVSADNFKWIVSSAPLPNNSPVWQSGYPDISGNQDCVYSYGYSNGDLANYGCGDNDEYICEKY